MLIIIAAYLPLLSLTSIEGLLFRPMALTVTFALIGAVLFSLVVMPPLATLLLRRGFVDWENPILTRLRPVYAGVIRGLLGARWMVVGVVLIVVAGLCVTVAPRLGTEFSAVSG